MLCGQGYFVLKSMLIYCLLIFFTRISFRLCERIVFGYEIDVVNSNTVRLIGSFPNVDVNWCIGMCKNTSMCTFINYQRLPHVCGIIGQTTRMMPTTSLAKHPGFVYGEKTEWNSSQWNTNLKAGCGPPPGVLTTTVRGNMYTPDSVTKYTCTNNDTRTEWTMCQAGGSWTPVTILCIPVECYTSPNLGVGIYKSSCYKIIRKNQAWISAKINCEKLGGYLTDISDRNEMEAVMRYVQSLPNYEGIYYSRWLYIGLTDIDREGTYKWLDGNVTSYVRWEDRQPSGGTRENCVVFDTRNFLWHDINCSDSVGSLCEFHLQ